MPRWNKKAMLLAGLFVASQAAAIGAGAQSATECHSVFFKADLRAGDNFERELGGGLLFRAKSQKDSGWFIDIVPSEADTKDYVYPVNLPLRFNGEQTLGKGYETVKDSLRYAHEMNFLLRGSDYDRVFGLLGNVLWSYQTKDPDKALADYSNAVDAASKGWLKVSVGSHKIDAKTGGLTRMKIRVQVITPVEFQFAPKLGPLPWRCHA
jgi:hypothetical protein